MNNANNNRKVKAFNSNLQYFMILQTSFCCTFLVNVLMTQFNCDLNVFCISIEMKHQMKMSSFTTLKSLVKNRYSGLSYWHIDVESL